MRIKILLESKQFIQRQFPKDMPTHVLILQACKKINYFKIRIPFSPAFFNVRTGEFKYLKLLHQTRTLNI